MRYYEAYEEEYLAQDEVQEIREMYKDGWTVSTLAYLNGCTEEEIEEILA